MNNPKSIYKVIFLNQGRVYELYARSVFQGNMYGFVEVEELIFGEKSSLLVNPAEEKLQGEFSGVRRTFIPLHSVIRIDEVEKEGVSKIREKGEAGDNIAFLPNVSYPPSGKTKD
ncbi:MAG: DUF1820 family protein [Gammaproteobacteria bacterium]|nr:DUF1820 family protein [Gammaproteobacteria bacterium]MCP5424272.1 DUF1820 family protein [Gammaproteobacteria bacterium]